MDTDHAALNDAQLGNPAVCSTADRILLHLTLAAGYSFLGFFGWLLTL